MGIQRNAGGGGSQVDPGEYVVTVHELKQGNSKAGKPMLTITFQTQDERTIKGYYVKSVQFHMHNLGLLKEAAGLRKEDPADRLHGRQVGILVENQPPGEDGRVWTQIAGYGPAADVSTNPFAGAPAGGFGQSPMDDDQVPF